MKLIFLHAHKHQNYLQDDITVLVSVVRHAQITNEIAEFS